MRELWHDIQTHPRAAVLFLGYWLAALADPDSRPGAVLLLSTPAIAGALVGRWRGSTRERIQGGILAGILCGGISILRIAAAEVIHWMGRYNAAQKFRGDEVLEFFVFFVVAGGLLGLAGAAITVLFDRFRRPGPEPGA